MGASPVKGGLLDIHEEEEEYHPSPAKPSLMITPYKEPEMDDESSFEASESPSPTKSNSPVKENDAPAINVVNF